MTPLALSEESNKSRLQDKNCNSDSYLHNGRSDITWTVRKSRPNLSTSLSEIGEASESAGKDMFAPWKVLS
jgi:hypothetical protein